MIRIKRIYDGFDENDGFRILVDRLWPRGIKKEDVKIDLWMKDVSPSDKLRKWFSHDLSKWNLFKKNYLYELRDKKEEIEKIRKLIKKGKVTLLFATKDEKHNNAVVLKEFLGRK